MRRIHFVPALLAATLIAVGIAAPAAAVQSNLTVFIDLDNDASTGCNDPVSGFNGYDQKVVTTVNTTGASSAQVTQIEGRNCANAVVFSDSTTHPVGFHNGDNGLNVIETYWPIVPASPPPLHPCLGMNGVNCLRLGVYAENANGGSDTLFTNNGAPTGPPILLILGEGVEIPTLSQWGLLILIVLLACAAALKLRRRPLRALLTVQLVLCAGGIAYAVLGDLDGNTLSEWTPGSRVAYDPSAVDDGDDIASLYARTAPPQGRVFFRIDASLVFNTPPVVTPTPGATTFTEDGPAVVVDSGITVTDADSPNLASATVTITNPQDGALETLAASSCAGLTVTPGLNSLSITGSATPTVYQTCFRSVTYNDTSNTPGTTPRTVAFVANDGIANSAPGNKTVNVVPNDDAPVVTTTAGSTAFTEDGGPVVVDNGVSVSDVDSPNLASATVTITNPQDGAAELLAATACAGLTVTPGLNTLSITGSQPLASYQTCLRSVTFDDTSNNPNTTNRIVRFVVNDGTLNSNNGDKTITVTPSPDAPVVTTTAGSTTFTEDGGAVVVDAGVTVTDPDDTNLASATVTITNVQDVGFEALAATSCAGLTVGGSGTPTLSISGTQPLATYQTCLQSVTYDNTDQDPSNTPRVISFVANDGGNSSAPANKTVTVTPVNDAPVVTTTGGTTAFTEAGGPVVVDGGVTVTDVDNANLASATVTITNVLDAGSEQLAATACGGLTVGGSGTATLNISGSATLAAYQTCLRSVTYDNSDQDPDTTNRVISFVANDGTASSAPANKTVSVAAVNNAPVVTTTGGSTAFTEDGGAVTIDSGLTVTDADNANLASATVTITNVQDVGFEALAATSCGGLTVGGSGTPTLNISGSATLAAYQTCLRSVTYNNTDQDPNNTARVISFVANDGTNSSSPANKTVTVAPVNDAPVVTTTGGTTAFTEDGGAVVVDSGLTVTDVDNANLASATVTITNVLDVGFEQLAATSCAGLTVGGSGTATLTISGSQPLATYQTCLRSVTYNDTDQDPNTTNRVISFVANDGTASSAPANKTVSVAAVNDAPVVTTTGGTTSFTEGAGAVVVDAGVTVTDVDSPNLASATVTITNVLDVGFESLAASSCAGLTVGGSGTPTLTISGSQPPATYQTCLQSVTYNNTDLDPDTTNRVISFVANDGALPSNTANKTVTVTAVNSAPVVTTTAGTTAFVEDAGPVVVDGGLTVTDVDSANLASATATITNPQDGALETMNATACAGLTVTPGLNSVSITGSQPPANYQTCLRSVTYNDASNTPNTTTRVISFVASDGAASSTPATKNVSVTPANDAPIVATTAGNTAFTEDGGAVVIDSGVTVVDPDSANLASATVTITNVQNVGLEALAATACGAFTVGGSGTPTLTITGSQPVATYQTCLQSVTYNNTSQNPNTTTRVISFVANDGALSSAPANKNVTVAAVNDAPVVTTTAGTTAFVEDAGAVVIDSGVTVTDVDSANLASATVTITNVQDSGAEALTATACGAMTVGGSGTATLTITGSQPLATYQSCLQSVRYNNSSNNPNTTTRVVSFVANDGALSSAPANKNVSVTGVNDAPVVTTTAGNTSFTEDGGAVVVDSGVTVSDVDNANLASATVTITNVQDVGFEGLAATACGALTIGGSGTPTLTLTGSQPLATYQTCLQSVTYNNTDQDPAGAPNRVVRFVVNDGTSNSNNGDKTVTVTPVNDAPVVTPSAGVTPFTEDGGAVVVDNGLTVTDVDNANLASATVTITNVLDPTFESLAATSCAGLTVTGGGTTSLSITGSQPKATYQTCLRSVTYNNLDQDPNATTRVIRFVVNDGALNSNNGDKQVSVTPVNDLPVCQNTVNYTTPGNTQLHVNATTPGVANWTDATSLLAKCNPTDPDGPSATTIVTVSGSSANSGSFTISNSAAGDFFYVPAAGFTGADSFSFSLNDGAGTNPQTANVSVGQRVWYIRDVVDANNAAGGDGRSTNAFDTITQFNAATTNDNDIIFVFAGNTATTPLAGSISLRNGQKLWGQGIALDLTSNGFGVLVSATTQPHLQATTASTNTVNVPATAGNRQNVEIRGLDLEATGATSNAIDVTSSGANQVGVTISSNNVRGATAEGIDLNNGSTGAFTATVGAAGAANTITSAGNGIDAKTTAAGTMTVNAANDTVTTSGGNSIDLRTQAGGSALNVAVDNVNVTASGTGILVDGSAAGTATVTSFSNPNVNGNTGGNGIVITSATFDSNLGLAAFQAVNAGNLVVGASGNGVGAAGVQLANCAGDLSFADFDVFADGGAGLFASGTTLYTGSAGLRVTMPGAGANVTAIGGPAVSVSTVTGTLTFSGITSTNTATTGVSLTNLADGGGTNSTFSAPSGSAITTTAGATGPIFNVSGGNAAITYGGTLTNSSAAARAVSVSTWAGDDAGDDISFSGAITENGAGILLNNNAGSAGRSMNFSGGLTINTTTGEGFAATSNTTPAGLNITGSTNDITSTSATALRVTSTTIGSSDLNFRKVSSGNNTAAADPVNGIVLNTTGALGGLKITGTGSPGQGGNDTGGIIQHTSGAGIVLLSTREPAFANVKIDTTGNSGVSGEGIVDFTYDHGTILDSGNTNQEANIELNGCADGSGCLASPNVVTGVVTITNNVLSRAFDRGVDIQQTDGTISNLTISNNLITSTTSTATSKGAGITVDMTGTSSTAGNVTQATVAGNTINNFPSLAGIQFIGGNSNATGPSGMVGDPASLTNVINITGNSISGQNNVNRMGTNAVEVSVNGGNSGARSKGNFNVSNNPTMTNLAGSGILVGNNGWVDGTYAFNNNVMAPGNINASPGISGGNGIVLSTSETPLMNATVTGNNISQTDGNGILLVSRGVSGQLNVGIRNNTVAAPLTGVRPGIRVDAGNGTSVDDAVCVDISNNVSGGSGGSAGIGIRKQGSNATVNDFGIEGLAPSPASCDQAEGRVNSVNPGAVATGTNCLGAGGSKTLAISGSNFVVCNTAP